MELYLHNNIVLCKENVTGMNTHRRRQARKKFNIDKTKSKKVFLVSIARVESKKVFLFQFLQAFCSDIDNRYGSILLDRKMSMD